MGWESLLTPVIIAAIPVIVAGVKKLVPASYRDEIKALYPVLALVLGPAIDQGLALLGARASGGKYALLYGLLGIAVREFQQNIQGMMQKDKK